MRLFHVTLPDDQVARITSFLNEENIKNISVIKGSNCCIVVFRVSDDLTQEVLTNLEKKGVGVNFGLVDVISIEANIPVLEQEVPGANKSSFFANLKERPHAVEEIYTKIASSARFSFDFLALTILSCLMAGIGLATDDGVHVVASMLLSPLMGPILASSLGVTIKDRRLFIVGLRSEAIGLLVCVLGGMVLGVVFGEWGSDSWPTSEMRQRGRYENILFGLLVAIGSGAGVAIGVTRGELSSLVGVAIAASLLPPAVNAGMMLVYGLLGPHLWGVTAENQAMAIEICGASFALFAVNVFFIYVMAILVFKMKGMRHFLRKDEKNWKDLPEVSVRDSGSNSNTPKLVSRSQTITKLGNAPTQDVMEKVDKIKARRRQSEIEMSLVSGSSARNSSEAGGGASGSGGSVWPIGASGSGGGGLFNMNGKAAKKEGVNQKLLST